MAKEPKTLKDIYFAEKKILATLPNGEGSSERRLKAAFEKHRDETEGQVERLNQVFAIIHK
jgi:ferritin-like metal-binding protein YciE